MKEEKGDIDYIKYRREKAYETIKEIEKLIKDDMLSTAMNRIYYAGFYIVNALIFFDNFSTSRHTKLIGFFNHEYVKTNKIDRENGKDF